MPRSFEMHTCWVVKFLRFFKFYLLDLHWYFIYIADLSRYQNNEQFIIWMSEILHSKCKQYGIPYCGTEHVTSMSWNVCLIMVTVTETCGRLYIIEYIVVFWLNDILVNTIIQRDGCYKKNPLGLPSKTLYASLFPVHAICPLIK